MSSFLYKKSGMEFSSIPESVYPVFSNQDNNFVSWTERLWLDHDQILNRIDRNLNSMLRQGMRAQDIAEKLFPGNAKSMRNDNIPKALIDAIS